MANNDASIKFSAETGQALSAIAQLRAKLDDFGRSVPGLGNLNLSFVAMGAAAGLAAGALSKLKDAVFELDHIDKIAQGIGITATKLSAFQLSAEAAGVESDQFTAAISKLNVKTAEAAGGNEQSAIAFRALGIAVKDAAGNLKGTDVILGEVADKFSRFKDGAEKNAIAVELFGRSGARLISFLNEGKEGLDKFGGASQDAIDHAVKLQNALDKAAASAKKFWFELSGTVIAAFTTPISSTTETIKKLDDEIQKIEKRLVQLGPHEGFLERLMFGKGGERALLLPMLQKLRGELEGIRTAAQDQTGGAQARAPNLDALRKQIEEQKKLADEAKKIHDAGIAAEFDDLKRIRANRQKTSDEIEDENNRNAAEAERRTQDLIERLQRETKATQQAQEERLEAFRAGTDTEEEAALKQHTKDLFQLVQFREDDLISEQEYNDRRLRVEDEYQAKKLGIANLYRKLDVESTTFFLNTVAGLLNTQNRAQFEIGKAAAIGAAIIATYSSATKSYDALANIPYVGPYLGAAAAAAATLAGIANVERIRSTSFGGGSTSASSPYASIGGATNTAGEPVSPVQGTPQAANRTINLQLLGGGRYSAQEVRDLINQLNEQAELGATINVSTV